TSRSTRSARSRPHRLDGTGTGGYPTTAAWAALVMRYAPPAGMPPQSAAMTTRAASPFPALVAAPELMILISPGTRARCAGDDPRAAPRSVRGRFGAYRTSSGGHDGAVSSSIAL